MNDLSAVDASTLNVMTCVWRKVIHCKAGWEHAREFSVRQVFELSLMNLQLRYVKGSAGDGLLYCKDENVELRGYGNNPQTKRGR